MVQRVGRRGAVQAHGLADATEKTRIRLAEDSARYKLLMSAMLKRIKEACKAVAEDQGNDLVVRDGDISNGKGLTESDLTTKVVDYVEKNSK